MPDEITSAIQSSIAGLGEGSGGGSATPAPDGGASAAPAGDTAPPSSSGPAPGAAAAPTPPPVADQAAPPPAPGTDPAAPALDPQTGKPARRNPIPLDRHEVAVKNAREAGRVEAETAGRATVTALQGQINGYKEFFEVLEHEPERFLQALAQVKPALAARLGLPEGAAPPAAPGHAAPAPAAPRAPMPDPDIALADGSRAYSPEGAIRLLDWHYEQKQADARAAEERRHAEARAARSAAARRVDAAIQDAHTWPGFTANQEAIIAEVKRDRRHTLESAYRTVVLSPRVQAGIDASRQTADQMRATILKEMQAKPLAASVTIPGSGVAPSAVDSGDIADVIRAAIAGIPGR
jgi:hypothetical protein